MSALSYRLPLRERANAGARARLLARPELLALLGLTAVLNLWNLGINGWANTYYSAAIRSMSTSWHNFLFASLDPSGLMTVDKPPLAFWVQALSVRIFGYHPLSILVPEALMGIVAVALLYDLVARRFGRIGGFVAGLALATTPITVAISRHNNPDELLVLCSVAALWFALRALDTSRLKWLVLSGVCVGLGFETKMGVALLIVPGVAAAWMWVAPRGRWRALRELVAGGAAMAVVGLAWPLLVMLTPAADRPWISGTSDNSIWSLIFGYNGLGRVDGQTGGPGGMGGGGGLTFGGSTGPLRLLNSALGDQAGWLLGFAIVSGLALLILTRLRRRDARTGWLIVVGGAFACTAVVFSFAAGIFHPYYVSLLAPFAAALVGAGVSTALSERRAARMIAPLAIAGGAVTELAVLGDLNGQLGWALPLVIVVGGLSAVLLAFKLPLRVRGVILAVAMAALLAAPATWATETLGHATSSTFPAGGSASAAAGGGRGGFGGHAGGTPSGGRFGGPPGAAGAAGSGSTSGPGSAAGSGSTSGAGSAAAGVGSLFAPPGSGSPNGSPNGRPFGGPSGSGGFGGGFGGDTQSLNKAIAYAKAHGGGTIGVESQSTAASAIVDSNGNVAGLGGFSGRESSVSVSWLAAEVKAGKISWLLVDGGGGGSGGPTLPGDTRTGSQSALGAAEKVSTKVTLSSGVTLYHLTGKAAAILAAAGE
jgi:4-amino-4-deoxy-L-arabinose transferase-like glycosyltransferase